MLGRGSLVPETSLFFVYVRPLLLFAAGARFSGLMLFVITSGNDCLSDRTGANKSPTCSNRFIALSGSKYRRFAWRFCRASESSSQVTGRETNGLLCLARKEYT